MFDICVSGVGMVTPLGPTREETWSNVIAGRTGIVSTEEGLAAPVVNFSPNGARSRMGDFAILAAAEALRHAGFDPASLRGANIGCAVSQSKPLMGSSLNMQHFDKSSIFVQGSESQCCMLRLDPIMLLSSFTGWSAEAVVKREFGLSGPSMNVVAACATGIASIATAAHWIRSGTCEIVLAGASESSLHPLYRAGFERMGVLAKGGRPECARPFDLHRSGFVMGEGAAVLLLESGESLRRRGGHPLAQLLGIQLGHSSADALRFDPEGTAIASLIRRVTSKGESPDYINAHGTGTRFNDAAETKGIRSALGRSAARVAVSSTKASTGHLLGAAGAIEAAFCVLALRDHVLPPTLHLETPDPSCDLDCVPLKARPAPIQTALSLSYGFGGQLGAVLFGGKG